MLLCRRQKALRPSGEMWTPLSLFPMTGEGHMVLVVLCVYSKVDLRHLNLSYV